jgi:hypothetical protein
MIHGNGLNILSHISSFHFVSSANAVAQLVEAVPYAPEVRGFDSRRYHWNFSLA